MLRWELLLDSVLVSWGKERERGRERRQDKKREEGREEKRRRKRDID
jgi:hypothetical protein